VRILSARYIDAMGRIFHTVIWLGGKIFSLSCGIFIGAALATCVVNKGPRVLLDLISTLSPAPLRAGEAGDTWLVVAEWRVALIYASLIAVVAMPIWIIVVWKGGASLVAAAIIGFVLSVSVTALVFMHDDSIGLLEVVVRNGLIGCSGAIAGLAVFSINRLLRKPYAG